MIEKRWENELRKTDDDYYCYFLFGRSTKGGAAIADTGKYLWDADSFCLSLDRDHKAGIRQNGEPLPH